MSDKHLMKDILAVSQDMLEAAGRGEWDRLDALHDKREDGLRRVFGPAQGLRPVDARAMLDDLQRLVRMNEQITRTVARERQCCGRKIRRLRNGRKASDSYLSASG